MGSIESSISRKDMIIVHQGSSLEKELEDEKSRMLKEFERTIV